MGRTLQLFYYTQKKKKKKKKKKKNLQMCNSIWNKYKIWSYKYEKEITLSFLEVELPNSQCKDEGKEQRESNLCSSNSS